MEFSIVACEQNTVLRSKQAGRPTAEKGGKIPKRPTW